MRRRKHAVLSAILLGGLVAGAIAGCGIPDRTDVVAVEAGPSAGLTPGQEDTPTRPTRTDTRSPTQFIKNYLQAAAGDVYTATDRANEFFAPDKRGTFQPPKEIQVIRLVDDPVPSNPGSTTVSLRVQPVGVIAGLNGILEPPVAVTTPSYTFEVESSRTGLYLTGAPQVLLLSDTALNAFYERRVIYFWNNDRSALVPDIRYMPRSIPPERQPTEIMKWLIAGPSPWLSTAVDPLPEDTTLAGNVPAVTNGKLQINLSGLTMSPDDPAFDRLRRQLMWSLRPYLAPQLELRFDNQVQGTYVADYLSSNLAARFGTRPERFAVYDGQICRLSQPVTPPAQRADSVPAEQTVPLVTAEVNHNVKSAAINAAGGRTFAALVVKEGTTHVLKVAASTSGTAVVFRRAVLAGAPGRPVWAITAPGNAASSVGLIPVAGQLYSFGVGSAVGPRLVDWQAGEPADVQTVSVAPDGRRIAVIARGRLYLAALTASGNTVQLGPPRMIQVLLKDLSAVDWSSEGFLVVAGRGKANQVAIFDVSIDGALQTERDGDLGTARITQLVAYPPNPVISTGDANVVTYVAGNVAYDVRGEPTRITVQDIVGAVPSLRAGALPGSPFFLM